jgi:hypothetical protein
MAGQLCWLPKFGANGQLYLHLRLEPHHPWKLYTACPGYYVPDFQIPGGSGGWATCQKLLRAGWTILPTQEQQRSCQDDSQAA